MGIPLAADNFSLWAGIECSITRIGDQYHDQLERSGHAKRPGDLALVQSLGVRTIRYPLLWERTVGYEGRQYQWEWNDERIGWLLESEMTPIVGLLHHGSGPRWTSLLHQDFPKHFADYAYQVAKRYPSLKYFTPVNEPLTTARFSGLYGHWYPHLQCDEAFVKILFNQCEGTIRAMEAILSVIPDAQHVQTEDLGMILSTPPLQYQADFENARRWLSTDLLYNRVDEQHELMSYLRHVGKVTDPMLEAVACSGTYRGPDILGFNHYVTSNRFLDHRHQLYPAHAQAGNGRDRYADVEAIRVNLEQPVTLKMLLRQAWDRYGRPLAVTETHLTCSESEQVRWLSQCWEAVSELKDEIDIRGVTAWALFGLYDWDTLTVQRNDHYEPGVFDVASGEPRSTALTALVRSITSGSYPDCSAAQDGWWERAERFVYFLDQTCVPSPAAVF